MKKRNNGENFARILSGEWKKELKKLPKYQKKELTRASELLREVEYYKFGTISFTELKKVLREIIKGGKG